MSYFKSLLIAALFLFVLNLNAQEAINPYNPEPKMEALKDRKGKKTTKMHFLVFGDSKGSKYFPLVLKRADALQPDFCITTADLVNKGGGEQGKIDYKLLDDLGGWFMRKYPMWPTVGNHEEAGGDDGVENFTNFFGMKKTMYSFEYGNAKFIALPWPKIDTDKKKLKWLKKELRKARGKHIFIYKHRPHYTVGSKSYEDVDGAETETTKLYDKYNVTAVFSGHDHIYYRTKRNNTNYIISAGAGAPIYRLHREKDAIAGDVYYGRLLDEGKTNDSIPFKFHAANGTETGLAEAMYYVLSVKIDGDKVSIEMIDEKTGKVWDKTDIN
ncbi:metallophosphoesterase family protein [Wocania ichthyoenteri]|uniref:metallophosphoesterase family protein n=1 Tax=Wocania ichthyoenteri TaxID=1230531 RepID=UPI00053DE244|nr:metallophosphoesterase [Wocania ichthyoenteri]